MTKFTLINSLMTGALIILIPSRRADGPYTGQVTAMQLESGGAERNCWNITIALTGGGSVTRFVRTID